MADTPKHLRVADAELERLKITHAIEVEDKKLADDHEEKEFNHKVYWTSCCLKMDRRAVSYFGQMSFSAAIIAFCISILATNQDCATFSRYSPLLTFVIGCWMPQPSLKSD